MNKLLLNVSELTTYYKTRLNEKIYAVDRVTFALESGKIIGIAGESGCGKSTLALSLMGFYFPPLYYNSGSILINDIDIMKIKYASLRKLFLGKEIAYIPQSAMNALNPTKKIFKFIRDIMKGHDHKLPTSKIKDIAINRFRTLNLPERVLYSFPNELSGGMKQRVVIAISTILNPKILIADEPTSALDVSSQRIVLDLLKDLMNKNFVQSIIFITHELPILKSISTDIMIMYAGEIIEKGKVNDVIFDPIHPYSKALMGAIIVPEYGMKNQKLTAIQGTPPNLKNKLTGCRFAKRCKYVIPECTKTDIQDKYFKTRPYKCIFDYTKLKEINKYEK
ncbi:MAG: ABC transporter ATP-binding protein [Clostridiales bacterium]